MRNQAQLYLICSSLIQFRYTFICHVTTIAAGSAAITTAVDIFTDALLLLLRVRLHDQSSSSDEVGALLQVLQAPI